MLSHERTRHELLDHRFSGCEEGGGAEVKSSTTLGPGVDFSHEAWMFIR